MNSPVQIILLGLALFYAINGQPAPRAEQRPGVPCYCANCPTSTTSQPPIRIQIEGRDNYQESIYRPPPPPPRDTPSPYLPVLVRDYPRYSPVPMPIPMPMPMPMPMSMPMSMPMPMPMPMPMSMPMPLSVPMSISVPGLESIGKSVPAGSNLINPENNSIDDYYMVPVAATRRLIKKKSKE